MMKHKSTGLILVSLLILLAFAIPVAADAPEPTPQIGYRFDFKISPDGGETWYSTFLTLTEEMLVGAKEILKNALLFLDLLTTPATPTIEPTPIDTCTETPTAMATMTETPVDCPETTEPTPIVTPTSTPTSEPTATLTANTIVNGIEYGTEFDGGRITFTNGEVLVGHTAPYTDTELAVISGTWVSYTIEMPENSCFAVAFGYSIKVDDKTYSPGALILLPTDQETVNVEILDGELVLWSSLSAMHDDIEHRISTEIKNGNLSVKGPLAFSFLSKEFSGYIPRNLLESDSVTIVR